MTRQKPRPMCQAPYCRQRARSYGLVCMEHYYRIPYELRRSWLAAWRQGDEQKRLERLAQVRQAVAAL